MATIYVSTTGSDSGSGASGSPVKSITKAAQLAKAGDTVLVAAGTYKGTVSIATNGTASGQITFKPVDGAKVVIDGAGTPANTDLVVISGDYITFQGFEVVNSTRTGIGLWGSHDSKVIGNNVHDSFRAGIYAGYSSPGVSYNNVIDGNEVWRNVKENMSKTWSGGWAQGISLAMSDNSTISNNNVYDNWGEGVGAMFTKGAKITGNTVYDSYSVGVYLDNAQDAVVQYNTVSHSYDTNFYRSGKPAAGIQICNENGDRMLPSSGIVITNNVLAGVGDVHYSTYGANTGLINSTIAPNTVQSSPIPAPTPGPTPTPTPTPGDDPVVAADDSYGAMEDSALTVDATKGVLANDSAPDGGKAAVAGTFATAQGGSVKLNADGSFVYTPKANFFGSDSFNYTAKDADGDTDTGTVTFKVTDVIDTTPTPTPTPTPSPRPTTTKTINGTTSANDLMGTSGNDLIDGKGGNDTLWGMNGSDVLIGGSGKDTFVFASAGSNALKLGSNNVDVIVDFNPADDTIQLGDAVFTKLAAGSLSSSAFVTGTKALDSSDRIIYNKQTGDLSYDADGTGSMAAVKFAVIENKAALTAADFYII